MGYETRLDDGSYPEPDSREAFMNKGNRADLDKRFYDGVAELCAGVGGEPAPARGLAELETLAASPVAVDARLPASDESVAKCAELCGAAADAWLAWTQSDDHDLKPGMQVTSTLARGAGFSFSRGWDAAVVRLRAVLGDWDAAATSRSRGARRRRGYEPFWGGRAAGYEPFSGDGARRRRGYEPFSGAGRRGYELDGPRTDDVDSSPPKYPHRGRGVTATRLHGISTS